MDDEENHIARERSPSFPYLDLGVSIELLRRLFVAVKMNELRVKDVAAVWEMAPKSGSLTRYLAALGQFGLIEATGSGDLRKVKVSASGRRILEDGRPGVKEQLCSEAALKPRLIGGLFYGLEGMPAWGRDRPADRFAESTLKFDLKFTSAAASRFLNVYDATINFITGVEEGFPSLGGDELKGEDEKSTNETPEAIGNKQSDPGVAALGHLFTQKLADPTPVNVVTFHSVGSGLIHISATLDKDGLATL